MTLRRALPFLGVLSYFLFMAWPGLTTLFSPDDMQNMYTYWSRPAWFLAKSILLVATSFYRPMAALFYLPIYGAFGLDPAPYRLVSFSLLCLNVWLLYCLAKRLCGSRFGGSLAALIGSYHAAAIGAYMSNAVIYDVLCFGFLTGTLLYYVRVRQQQRPLGWRESLIVLALFAGALDSKEMGITLPAMLLLYEALFNDWWKRRPTLAEMRPILLCSVLAALFALAVLHGPGTLTGLDAYRPSWTPHQYMKTSRIYAAMLFLMRDMLSQRAMLLFWLGLFAAAGILRRRDMAFGAGFALIAFLPLNFVSPREGYALYIPLIGFSIWAAGFITAMLDLVPVRPGWRPAMEAATAIACAAILIAAHYPKSRDEARFLRHAQELTWATISSMRTLDPKIGKGSRILLSDNPFGESWDPYFIAKLYFNDPDLKVGLLWPGKTAPVGDEMFRFDHKFHWINGRMVEEK